MRALLSSLIAGFIVLLLFSCGGAPPEETPPTDGSTKQRPMGKLGHPIGTYLRIEGFREPHKNPSNYRIHMVNGKRLESPVLIWIENLALPRPDPSVRCVVNGYERIEWMGESDEVTKAEGSDGTQLNFQRVWLFRVTSVAEPQGLEIR